MDYSHFKQLEFKRKFFQFTSAQISIFDPASNALVGYVKMKIFKLRSDIRVYTDMTMQREIVRIGARQIFGFKPVYNILDSNNGMVLSAMRFRSLRTYLLRGHIDLLDAQGNQYGYVQETSSQLAVMRRWVGVIPVVGPLF